MTPSPGDDGSALRGAEGGDFLAGVAGQRLVDMEAADGFTPLLQAAASGHTALVIALRKVGANVDHRDNFEGRTGAWH
jgi:hypothetical protein